MKHSFLVGSTRIEKTTFPHKTTLSEGTVKTNRIGSTKLTYHKERFSASNYITFWKFSFSLNNYLNIHIHTFRFTWGCLFHVSILKWYLLFSNEYLIPQRNIYVIDEIKSVDDFKYNIFVVFAKEMFLHFLPGYVHSCIFVFIQNLCFHFHAQSDFGDMPISWVQNSNVVRS